MSAFDPRRVFDSLFDAYIPKEAVLLVSTSAMHIAANCSSSTAHHDDVTSQHDASIDETGEPPAFMDAFDIFRAGAAAPPPPSLSGATLDITAADDGGDEAGHVDDMQFVMELDASDAQTAAARDTADKVHEAMTAVNEEEEIADDTVLDLGAAVPVPARSIRDTPRSEPLRDKRLSVAEYVSEGVVTALRSSNLDSMRAALSADEQFHRMPTDASPPARFSGVIVMDNTKRAFGFVSPDIGGPDVFFTREAMSLEYTKAVAAVLEHQTWSTQCFPDEAHRRSLEERVRVMFQGRSHLIPGEPVEFEVSVNHSGGSGGGQPAPGRKKLRATRITGLNGGPTMLERVVFNLTGTDALVSGEVASRLTASTSDDSLHCGAALSLISRALPPIPAIARGEQMLDDLRLVEPRMCGWVKNITSDGERGYVRPDSQAWLKKAGRRADHPLYSADSVLHMEHVTWDASLPPGRRRLAEGVMIEFSIAWLDRNRKPVAVLVTGPNGAALHPESWQLTEEAKRKQSESTDGGSGVASDDRDGSHLGPNSRKRGRHSDADTSADQQTLLLGDDAGYFGGAW